MQWLGGQAKQNICTVRQEQFELVEVEAIVEPEDIDERTAKTSQDEYIDELRGPYIPIQQGWIGVGNAMGEAEAEN